MSAASAPLYQAGGMSLLACQIILNIFILCGVCVCAFGICSDDEGVFMLGAIVGSFVSFVTSVVGVALFTSDPWTVGIAGVKPDLPNDPLAKMSNSQRDNFLTTINGYVTTKTDLILNTKMGFTNVFDFYFDRQAVEKIQAIAAPAYYTAMTEFYIIVVLLGIPIAAGFCYAVMNSDD